MKITTDEESKNVMWVVDKPTKHDLEEFAEMLSREGHNRMTFKNGKIILWWDQISLSEGKIFFFIRRIHYAEIKEKSKFLYFDIDRKLKFTDDNKVAQSMNSILLYNIEDESIGHILARIEEIENKKK